MISFTSAQLNAWIVLFIYPATRILAFAATAPLLNNVGMPRRIRLMLGLALTVAIAPSLPPMPDILPTSGPGVLLLMQQIMIGVGMGFAMRVVFAGFDLAGQIMGFQMGLGFATFYDPLSTTQTIVVSNFLTLIATLLFLSLNGHLVYFATLAQSFHAIPVSVNLIKPEGWLSIALDGRKIFTIGLILSLPVVTVLLVTNLALGVLNRAAPQLNLFAIGFPVTLGLGFFTLALTLGNMGTPLQHVFEEGLANMLKFVLAPNQLPDGR